MRPEPDPLEVPYCPTCRSRCEHLSYLPLLWMDVFRCLDCGTQFTLSNFTEPSHAESGEPAVAVQHSVRRQR